MKLYKMLLAVLALCATALAQGPTTVQPAQPIQANTTVRPTPPQQVHTPASNSQSQVDAPAPSPQAQGVTPMSNPQSRSATPVPNATQSQASTSTPSAAAPTPGNLPAVRIGPGDLLQVSVYGAADFNPEVRVSQAGDATLPLIGNVRVAGLTPTEASDAIAKRLSDGGFFNKPQVLITIREYTTQSVSVLGEVNRPGIYPMLGSRTLFDAISAAQGTTQTAGRKVTIVHRDRPEQPETVTVTYDSSGVARSNVPVNPGDTIVVEKAGIAYVVGDVRRPAGFVIDRQLTVLQAIAMAEGANPTAKLNGARLIRRTPEGPTEQKLELSKMLAAQAPDVPLRPDDIVFVPTSAAKSATMRGIEAAIQMTTGLVIWGGR